MSDSIEDRSAITRSRMIDDVFAEIATWKNYPDELSKRGITGTPECSERCPMANYILRETGANVSLISVDFPQTSVWEGSGNHRWIDNPPGMNEFISDFDAGEYPDLSDDPGYWTFEDADWGDEPW